MQAKSEVWKSGGDAICIQIIERSDGKEGIRIWSGDEADKGVFISLDEAEAIVNAMAYFKCHE